MDLIKDLPEWATPILELMAGKYGWVGQSFVVITGIMGSLRLFMKPLQTLAKATPWQWDDRMIDKLSNSTIYKGFSWLVDYLCSIKLPKKS